MTSKKANQTNRKRGKDKVRRSFELNGKYSAKHLRAKEKLLENTVSTPPPAVSQEATSHKKKKKK